MRTLVLTAKRINIFGVTIRLILLILCLVFVITAIRQSETHIDFTSFANVFYQPASFLIFLMVLLLAPLNWGLEAFKWKLMTSPVEEISFKKACHSTFTGFAAGFATPNRVGDYYGRTLPFQKANALKIAAVNLVSGFVQFIATALFGICGVMYLMLNLPGGENIFQISLPYVFSLAIIFLMLHVIVLFYPAVLIKPLSTVKWLGRYVNKATGFEYYTRKQLLFFIFLSVLRTLVFTIQMHLLMKVLGIDLSFALSLMLISAYFFILTVSPSLMMNKLGLRESISVMVFGAFVPAVWTVVSAVFMLWLLNQVLPVCAGAWLMLRYKPE